MIYNMTIDTPSYMCDVDDRLHTWAAVRLCQEVTEYHGNATGIGFKTLVQQNRAWVITRALYNIYRLPNAFEKISLDTWSRNNNGLIAYRDYRVTNADGEVLLTGTSAWPIVRVAPETEDAGSRIYATCGPAHSKLRHARPYAAHE